MQSSVTLIPHTNTLVKLYHSLTLMCGKLYVWMCSFKDFNLYEYVSLHSRNWELRQRVSYVWHFIKQCVKVVRITHIKQFYIFINLWQLLKIYECMYDEWRFRECVYIFILFLYKDWNDLRVKFFLWRSDYCGTNLSEGMCNRNVRRF